CTACQRAKRKCSAVNTPLVVASTKTPLLPAPTPFTKPPPPPIPPCPIRPLPSTIPLRSELVAALVRPAVGSCRVVSVVIPQAERSRRHDFSCTPAPFLKRPCSAHSGLPLATPVWQRSDPSSTLMAPHFSFIDGTSRPPKRRALDGPSAALIKWFDNRWVIQSYLGIPLTNQCPISKTLSRSDSPSACRPLRLSRLTTIFRPTSILPPMFWPILRETPLLKSLRPLHGPGLTRIGTIPAPKVRLLPKLSLTTALASRWGKQLLRCALQSAAPYLLTPAPLARPDTPFARRYVPAMAVNEFLWYMDDAYIVALQWLASTPSDRHNRYKMFHHNCQLLRGSAANVIPFNGSFGGSAPQIAPPSAISAWPTSRVPPPNGAQNVTPSPVWLPRNQLPTGNAPVNSPCPTQFRY
ncbi:hypothetical protein PSHT_13902, partial [Puccinia striiformis]